MDIVCCLLFNPYRLGLVNIKIPAQQRTGHSLTAWNAVKMANWEKLQNVMDWTDALSWRLPDCSHQISAKLRYASIYLIMRCTLFLVRL